ncbi:MAG: hypothetical protein LC634_02365 [Sphingomonadales bacterium]|nr:hypothetical protein [Sphingomonadales bacterium]
MLRIPALYVVALWLHAQGEREDMIIPMAPAPQEFNSEQTVYTVDEFDEALRNVAARQAELATGIDEGPLTA